MASSDHLDDEDLSNVENITPKAKNIKLKYKPVKKAKPRVTKKSESVQRKNTKKMSTVIEQKDEEINQKSEDNVEVVKILSPNKPETPKSNNKETPLIRRKRKLYSHKDDAFEEDVAQYSEEKTSDEAPLSRIKEIEDSSKAQATAMCYKEIEKERKKYTRLPRTRKSKGIIAEPPSPRTAKINTAFDNLKERTESYEPVRLASKDDDVYNFSSDSEDEDFKKKKIEIKKRIRVARRTTKQKALEKVAVDLVKISLVDEKMREAVREKLNTSIVVEPPTHLETVELEPILQQARQLEHIQESESNDTVVTKKRTKKRTKKNKAVAVKKEKAAKKVKKIVEPDNDDGSSSSLPSLLVEKSKSECKDDINDSLDSNMLQKFQKVVRDGPESNDSVLTQNMLSDVEKLNSSAQNYNRPLDRMYLEDYYKAETTKKQNTKALPTKPNKKVAKKKIETPIDEIIEIQDSSWVFDTQSDKSIASDGITAHVDDDKLPPAVESIVETLQPRELHDLTQTMKDFFVKLTKETLDESSRVSLGSNKSAKRTSEVDNTSARYPVIPSLKRLSLERLSLEDMSKWMPSRRTSDTDSPQARSVPKKNSAFPRSGPSSSSVKDWLEKISPTAEDRTMTLKDEILEAMERINTTLVEIDRDSSKNLVNLFVEFQNEFDAVAEVLSTSYAMILKCKERFETQALELIRKDCKKKRAVLLHLKDKIQAALNRMDEEED